MDNRVAIFGVLGLLVVWYINPWAARQQTFDEMLSDVEVPQGLKEHTKEFREPKVIKITDDIYFATGFAIANTIMVRAPEGLIIVDVTESVESATETLAAFRKIINEPIKAIIYTHYHPDHTYGAKGFIEDPENPPDIWSHHTTVEEFRRIATIGPAIFRRSMRQFGVLLPQVVNAGIGPRLHIKNATMGLVYPNKFLYDQEQEVTIAGKKLVLFHVPGETSDQIAVWLPDERILMCADDFYKAFPNLYAIRGTKPRDLRHWIRSLDTMRNLRPQHLLPSHTRPLEGEDYIFQMLTEYRDAIQLVHDQTVRFLNQGMFPEEIVKRVKLPQNLKDNQNLQEYYGTVGWSVKAVFANYLGWYSGDPVDLWPLEEHERSQRLVALVGGNRKAADAAQAALSNNDPQWGLELATHVLRLNPEHEKAREVRFAALKILAGRQTSANGRNYYLTMALEDRGLENKVPSSQRQRNVHVWPMWQLLEVMTVRYMPEACPGLKTVIIFDFNDIEEKMGFDIRNDIAEFIRWSPKSDINVNVWVRMDSELWRGVASNTVSPFRAYVSGDIKIVEGGILQFRNIMSCFDSTS